MRSHDIFFIDFSIVLGFFFDPILHHRLIQTIDFLAEGNNIFRRLEELPVQGNTPVPLQTEPFGIFGRFPFGRTDHRGVIIPRQEIPLVDVRRRIKQKIPGHRVIVIQQDIQGDPGQIVFTVKVIVKNVVECRSRFIDGRDHLQQLVISGLIDVS